MTLWGTVTALQKPLGLGVEPLALQVEAPTAAPESEGGAASAASGRGLTAGLRALYQKCQLYDVYLVVGGSRFPAHRAALAALSSTFRVHLHRVVQEREAAAAAAPGHPELPLEGVSSAEAVRALLDFAYGLGSGYSVSSEAANTDVLRLAATFDLPQLRELAAGWLVQGLTTANVVRRLAMCEQFGLAELQKLVCQEVALDLAALRDVSDGTEVLEHPRLLQALLVEAAALHRPPEPEPEQQRAAPALDPPSPPKGRKGQVKRELSPDNSCVRAGGRPRRFAAARGGA